MRVLLAEDDIKLGNLIKHMLEKSGVYIDWVLNGDLALEYALYDPYDVLVLDWMMPQMTGIEVCQKLRNHGYNGAILMLTAKDALEDKVLGLDTGVDDYLIKPFEFEELFARVRALARRSRVRIEDDIYQIGNLMFNERTHCICRGDLEIKLTIREFQLLELLARNKNSVIPREVILERVWGLEGDVSSNNLDAYIKLLRKKLLQFEDIVVLKTIRGIGYTLEVTNV
ncbi:MAG TPA: response regulator transcription factor [Candidatus Avacidaminococcus intestinavium]|uniref:Response regulator transcription factor n=1 Tax=Candidatus Avacidaminococcus intestinavium TaxID=2840684 RepID=A0A9D1MR43_9FIRM|nr:response regulator transcription factor [Candidatus Avacidaminococcus intestinavium]